MREEDIINFQKGIIADGNEISLTIEAVALLFARDVNELNGYLNSGQLAKFAKDTGRSLEVENGMFRGNVLELIAEFLEFNSN